MGKTEHSGVTVRIHIKWDDGDETIDCPLDERARRENEPVEAEEDDRFVRLLAEKDYGIREAVAERDRLVGVIQDKNRRIEELTRELSAAYGSLNAYRSGRLCAPQIALDAIAERERQIAEEGFAPGHDDTYSGGQLAMAAAAYAASSASSAAASKVGSGAASLRSCAYGLWPWAMEWWKPSLKDPRRDIVKAIALLFAEGERLDRRAAMMAHIAERKARENGHG